MEGHSENTFPRNLEEIATTKPVYKSPYRKKKEKPYQGETVTILDCSSFFRKFGITHPGLRRIWFVKDICGLVCAIMTWLLIVYAMYVMMFVMLLHESYSAPTVIHGTIFYFFTFLAVSSHLRTMLSDPGAVPKGNATSEGIKSLGLRQGEVVFKCPKCISIKPDRAHHCSVCQRCIKKMDHHCPWVNNCVGENNQKYFILFTLYICIISIHALYLAIMHFITCIGKDWKGCSGVSPPATTVFLIFLIFEGMLFGIFTAIMFGTQISAVCSDETGIEQLKKEQRDRRSFWLSLKGVFGHPFSIHWFSPFSTPRFLTAEKIYYSV